MSSTFRASPWVTYQPTADPSQPLLPQPPPNPSGTTMVMDMDVDMDAPQISALREDSPPPPAKKARTGPKVKAPKLKVAEPSDKKRITAPSDGDDLEELYDEEDQLLDDETGIPPSSLPRSTEDSPKKKVIKAKKLKKEDSLTARSAAGSSTSKPVKRTPKKATSAVRTKATPLLALDDAMSEAGFSATAMSSPATNAGIDLPDTGIPGTPDTEAPIAPSSPALGSAVPLIPEEPPNLEGVAIPQYPLPTKPFPVQAAVKITTGFAPPAPLDRSGRKVRHWKVANREIKGIAGGRWFARTWVGEKESELADSAPPKFDEKSFIGHHVTAPAGARASLSAPAVGRGRGRGGSKSASAVGSTVPSRSASVVGDPAPGGVKVPTKMRILHLPPSEDGESPKVTVVPPPPELATPSEPAPATEG